MNDPNYEMTDGTQVTETAEPQRLTIEEGEARRIRAGMKVECCQSPACHYCAKNCSCNPP